LGSAQLKVSPIRLNHAAHELKAPPLLQSPRHSIQLKSIFTHAVVPLQGTKIFPQRTQGCALRADPGLMQFSPFGGFLPFTIHHSPFTIHHSPIINHQSSIINHQSLNHSINQSPRPSIQQKSDCGFLTKSTLSIEWLFNGNCFSWCSSRGGRWFFDGDCLWGLLGGNWLYWNGFSRFDWISCSIRDGWKLTRARFIRITARFDNAWL